LKPAESCVHVTVISGDAIHTVKPFFGLGVNSAFEDILALESALNSTQDNVEQALQLYSKSRAAQAKALVKISRQLDGGTLSFLVPLILDSIFNKIAPWIFSGQ